MEEEGPRKREALLAPRNYDGWSVGDFAEHIEALRAEMARAEAAKAAKSAGLSAAAAFFRPPA